MPLQTTFLNESYITNIKNMDIHAWVCADISSDHSDFSNKSNLKRHQHRNMLPSQSMAWYVYRTFLLQTNYTLSHTGTQLLQLCICSHVFRFLCALNDTERGASIHLWWMSLITRHRYIDTPPAYALMSHQIIHYWMVYDTRHKYSFMASSHHTWTVQHSELLVTNK